VKKITENSIQRSYVYTLSKLLLFF